MSLTKKVLIQVRDLRVGSGIATCIMNYYNNIIQSGFQVDFLMNRIIDSPYMDMIIEKGSNTYVLPVDTNKPNIKNFKYIKEVMENGYDILHVNISGLNACIALRCAKKCGVQSRIYHTHTIFEQYSVKSWLRSQLYVKTSVRYATYYAACSKHAARSLFGDNDFFLIPNVFDVDKFSFNAASRERLRKELSLDGKIVLGAVGRLAPSKNPLLTIKIFQELYSLDKSYAMVWAGDGELKEKVEKYIQANGLTNHIRLLGNRNDISDIYSAMDIFVLPTKFEGLGLVFLEAQASGLMCFASDQIPDDVLVTENIHTVSLESSISEWVKVITSYRNYDRSSHVEDVKIAGFDITSGQDAVSQMYMIVAGK